LLQFTFPLGCAGCGELYFSAENYFLLSLGAIYFLAFFFKYLSYVF